MRSAQPDTAADSWRLISSVDPIELRTASGHRLFLTFQQAFHHGDHPSFAGESKVFTDSYSYRVRYSERAEDALFAWHWHPSVRPECHLHIGAPHAIATDLHKKHVPAGRVSFEEVLLFLIAEMEVQPLRRDYLAVLGDSLARFDEYKSWAGSRKPEPGN